ncbi:MAG TPA: hypothetical protein VLF19_07900 [Methylomirabilota bacterium]|nr:hypothetical protein [Methylomirabilota bacterium]
MTDVDVMIQVAGQEPSIARVLREICALEGGVRSLALDLVAAQLRTHARSRDLLEAIAALRRDDVARRIAEALARTR